MTDKVRHLDAMPNLNNIPHMLRQLASELEAEPNAARTVLLVVMNDPSKPPSVHHFGQERSRLEEIGALAVAQHIMMGVETND